MSLIEKAVERLDKLKQAAGEPVTAPRAPAPTADAAAEVDRILAAEVVAPAVVPEPAAPVAGPASRTIEVDLARLGMMGMVTPDQPRSPIAEEYRVIKRPLLRNATAKGQAEVKNGSLIMVTSAMPGEGKSFTAINLAISMAMELDYTVLLVDADVSRPSVLNRLGLPPERGLMDVLTGEVADLGDVLLRTNIEKLSILPAGMPHQRATELIASESMNRLLEQMANRYSDRIIVFDSPPLLVTTEARVLAGHMGQIVVVVEAERTTRAVLTQALSTIENCPIKLMVLNKARERGAGGYYGYGYGYGAEARSEAA
ncbi:XrtA-associated tyrosine autokinase [Azoarcus olearius]|uniref:non-specific protein-tyrosine kinase n=1 Tax=Azoarcus sp. (strain BH72) TaxID=418699 RepID=A1KAP1_AZOSB|nr:XrtA-associated tyrosine autokinase [Azoarcus olearius]ANQ86441.1 protein-tyrosine kinase [Azoarcus olearius]CAL95897.1 protein-tyrosine kinase [Azoarcus olearius]